MENYKIRNTVQYEGDVCFVRRFINYLTFFIFPKIILRQMSTRTKLSYIFMNYLEHKTF